MYLRTRCLSAALLIVVGCVAGENNTGVVTPCMTARGKDGVCIEHQACPFVMRMIDVDECRDYVERSKCGPKNEDSDKFRVCCPLQYNNECDAIVETRNIYSGDAFDGAAASTNNCCRVGKREYATTGAPIATTPHFATSSPPQSAPGVVQASRPLDNMCGQQSPFVENRVFGGEAAQIGEFPWLVILQHRNDYGNVQSGCIGFLVSEYHVLTAAHCVKSTSLRVLGPIYQVVLGEHNTLTSVDCTSNRTVCADPVVTVQTETPIVHADYDPTSSNHVHDIAIIPLKERVAFSNYVRPICLLRKPSNQRTLWVSGWGRTESDLNSNVKLRAAVQLADWNECQRIYNRINVTLTDWQLCAGDEGRDSCRGDSGGPLMVKDLDNVWYAEGIVSFGYVCGKKEWPAVYTHIPSYEDWIMNILTKHEQIGQRQ